MKSACFGLEHDSPVPNQVRPTQSPIAGGDCVQVIETRTAEIPPRL
jgi:hypothetical protein